MPRLNRPTLGTALVVEGLKLRRSLALVLALAAPLLIAVFQFFQYLRMPRTMPWDQWAMSAAAIWAFFLLPMSVTALTALVAQVEHAPRSWDSLRALPRPRWHLYAAKLAWILVVVSGMAVLVLASTVLALHLAAAVDPSHAPTGRLHLGKALMLHLRMVLAAFLMIAVQLWLALRYASFVPALATGIAGTFFAVVATSAKAGLVLPWQLPVNMLASQPWRMHLALGLGLVGGLVAMAAMIMHLSRREVTG
jgi:lantibiotic transport system permease protein